VSDESAAEATVKKVIRDFGHIDVLINNAGTAGPGGPTWTTSPLDWWHVHETNVKGPLVYMSNVLPGMIERNTGTIINIGSYAALRPTPGNSAYASSKAALARITDSLAAEVAQYNIHIFCLSPGLVKTEMTRGVPIFADIPEREWNKPEDICHLVKTLLNNDYGELSGRFIHVKDDVGQLLKNAERIRNQGLYQLRMGNLDGSIE
jgi:NAD(P)-dependent dehydrogenase (short-subunit alcohol dehydrogenase family)